MVRERPEVSGMGGLAEGPKPTIAELRQRYGYVYNGSIYEWTQAPETSKDSSSSQPISVETVASSASNLLPSAASNRLNHDPSIAPTKI